VRGGLDLGGTKIQAAVLDDDGEIKGKSRQPTPGKGGPPAVVEALANALAEAAADAGVKPGKLEGVGVGSPGAVDAAAGTVAEARNIPEWSDEPYPVGPELSQRVGVPVALGNDVQVAVEAEYRLGAGKGSSSLLGVFWGTGVGGGIILDGKAWLGRGAAAEIGHMVVKKGGARCPCGRIGCMEAYAGRGAMEARARELVDKGRETVLFEIMEERGRKRLQSGIWERALKAEDELAIELIDRALEALGAGIASAVNLLDVETVVIGGGLGTRLGEPYVKRIEEQMQPHLFVDERPPAVRLAALGDLGGATGAALLVGSRPVS
jgi:glucokinase